MKTIAWDVDDTLNNFTRTWFLDWWLPRQGKITLNYSQLIENPPSRLLGINKSEYLSSLDAFRISETAGKVKPLDQVLDWFQKHGDKTRHIALTATPLIAAPISAAWVMKHFGRWIRSYNVIPSTRVGQRIPVYDRSKAEFLNWFGKVDILVEDNKANLESAQNAGYITIGIPQPWNDIQESLEDILTQLTTFVEG
jgi:phosphoglycolate phosphatase-like HAD superfamily hydrolase